MLCTPDLRYCLVSRVLNFLQELLDNSKSLSMKVYNIIPHHSTMYGASLGGHKLVIAFQKGTAPLSTMLSPPKNIQNRISPLYWTPFRPFLMTPSWMSNCLNFQQSLEQTTCFGDKLALHIWWLDDSRVALWLNLGFLSKDISPTIVNQLADLVVFFEPADHSLLCSVYPL